jgi:hypothetical protein
VVFFAISLVQVVRSVKNSSTDHRRLYNAGAPHVVIRNRRVFLINQLTSRETAAQKEKELHIYFLSFCGKGLRPHII